MSNAKVAGDLGGGTVGGLFNFEEPSGTFAFDMDDAYVHFLESIVANPPHPSLPTPSLPRYDQYLAQELLTRASSYVFVVVYYYH